MLKNVLSDTLEMKDTNFNLDQTKMYILQMRESRTTS